MFVSWFSARRSSLGLKLALVTLHLVYAGVLFLFDGDLIEKTKSEPWCVGASSLHSNKFEIVSLRSRRMLWLKLLSYFEFMLVYDFTKLHLAHKESHTHTYT